MIQDSKETDGEQGQNKHNCMVKKNMHFIVATPKSSREEEITLRM